MKKKLFVLILMIAPLYLWAAPDISTNLIAPFYGGGGINLLSTAYDGGKKGWEGYENGPNPNPGCYNDQEMIALGGILNGHQNMNDISKNDLVNNPIYVTVTCPSGLFFTSQSNSAYKVPFEIELVERYYNSYGGTNNGTIHSISSTSNTAEIKYPEDGSSSNPGIWFDMVLVLPADNYNKDTTNGDNVLEYDGAIYNIVPNDDYSALVTITMQWKDITRSIVVPFSGYVPESSSSSISTPTTSSLYLVPTGYSTNMNIATDYGRWIDVANFNFKMFAKDSEPSNRCKLFLSASANPEVCNTQGFLLINENASSHVSPAMDESLAYKARIYRTRDAKTSKEFDGKDFVAPSNVDWGSIGALETLVEAYDVTDKSELYSQVFDGTVQVMLDTPLSLMKEGRYEDELYLHIYSYR